MFSKQQVDLYVIGYLVLVYSYIHVCLSYSYKAFIINSKISPENTEQCFILPEIALTKFSDI